MVAVVVVDEMLDPEMDKDDGGETFDCEECWLAARPPPMPPPMAPASNMTNPMTTVQNTGTDNPSNFVSWGCCG